MEKSIYTNEYAALTRLLQQCRQERGLTQVELAQVLGQSQSFVSKFERGERRLDIVQLREVCHALGIPLKQFVGGWEREIRKTS